MLVGQKVVLIPRGDRTRLMASEVPLMYGMVVEVVTVGGCEGGIQIFYIGYLKSLLKLIILPMVYATGHSKSQNIILYYIIHCMASPMYFATCTVYRMAENIGGPNIWQFGLKTDKINIGGI